MTAAMTGILLNLLMFNLAVPITNEVTVPESKPMYTVSIEAHNVAYELRVNDIPVLNSGTDASGELSGYPINPWLINGKNTVSVRLLKVENSTTDPNDPKWCKVVVSGPHPMGKPGPTLVEVQVKPAPKTGPDRSSSREGSFSVALTYPNPVWATSAKIGKDAATQKLILDQFREFHRLLTKKDLDGVMQFSAVKTREFSQAIYDPSYEASQKKDFKAQFASAGELLGIDRQAVNGLRYQYYFGDRLVGINNDENNPIIQYHDATDGTVTEVALLFYFDGKKFVLVR